MSARPIKRSCSETARKWPRNRVLARNTRHCAPFARPPPISANIMPGHDKRSRPFRNGPVPELGFVAKKQPIRAHGEEGPAALLPSKLGKPPPPASLALPASVGRHRPRSARGARNLGKAEEGLHRKALAVVERDRAVEAPERLAPVDAERIEARMIGAIEQRREHKVEASVGIAQTPRLHELIAVGQPPRTRAPRLLWNGEIDGGKPVRRAVDERRALGNRRRAAGTAPQAQSEATALLPPLGSGPAPIAPARPRAATPVQRPERVIGAEPVHK